MQRLAEAAKIDLKKIGIILIGDPAQLLAIGGEPCWSIKTKKSDKKSYSDISLHGLSDFRQEFGMRNLTAIPGFSVFKQNEVAKKPTLAQRKQISKFTDLAFEGTYESVFLTEQKRAIAEDDLCTRHNELVNDGRFGHTSARNLIQLKQIFANKSDVENDEKFKKARIVEDRHFFNPDEPNQKTVESENIRRIFQFAQENNQPVVHLKALHMPIQHASILQRAPGRQFESLLKDFVACKDLPVLLLQNFAPQFGLYNGATCYFHGLLYLPDDADITLTKESFKKIKMDVNYVKEPYDLNPQGYAAYSRFHQLPVKATLIKIDESTTTSPSEIDRAIANKDSFCCRFRVPNGPPALPDFVVVRSDEYKERGGPNILGFSNSENLIPIPCVKAAREKPHRNETDKKRTIRGYRIGFKLECAIVITPYKLQGETTERQVTEIKDHAHVPGLWNVAISRTKHPKHNHIPDDQWPSAIDIQSQRLNPFVIEAEIFERTLKIKAAQTLRRRSVEFGVSYGESWTEQECDMADIINDAYKNQQTSLPSIVEFIRKERHLVLDHSLIQRVVDKINQTDERLLKEDPPYLSDEEYHLLLQHQKPRKW